MEEAPENGKESSHSAHANGMNERMRYKQKATERNYFPPMPGVLTKK
jgi:hypothetical protein